MINTLKRSVKPAVITSIVVGHLIVIVASVMIIKRLLEYIVELNLIGERGTAQMISNASETLPEIQKVLQNINYYYSLVYIYLLKLSKILGLQSRLSKIIATAGVGVTGKLTLNRLMGKKLTSHANVIMSAIIGAGLGASVICAGALLNHSQLTEMTDIITNTLTTISTWTNSKEYIESTLKKAAVISAVTGVKLSLPQKLAVSTVQLTAEHLSGILRSLMYVIAGVGTSTVTSLATGVYRLMFHKKITEAEHQKVLEYVRQYPELAQQIRNK